MDLAIAFFIVFSSIGLALDFAFHRRYNTIVKDVLTNGALKFDDITYTKLIHDDAEIARSQLDRIFGYNVVSIRLIVVSLISAGSIYILINTSHEMYKGFDIDTFTFVIPFLAIAVIVDQLSLKLTRMILKNCNGHLIKLLSFIFLDIFLVILLIGVPWAVAGLINDVLLGKLTFLYAFNAFPYAYLLSTKTALLPFWLPFSLNTITLHLFLMLVIYGSPILPSLFHLVLLLRDLSLKMIIIPTSTFAYETFETLYKEERPVSKMFIAIGVLPLIIKYVSKVL